MGEHALSASSLMQEVINVTNVKNSSTHLLRWKILFALSVSQPQLKKRLNTTLSTCQKSRRNWKFGWNSQAWRENGPKIQLEWLKLGLIWVSSPSASPETLNGVCQYQSKNSRTKFSMCGTMPPSGIPQSQQTCWVRTTQSGGRIQNRWSFTSLWVRIMCHSIQLFSPALWSAPNKNGLCCITFLPQSTLTTSQANFLREMVLVFLGILHLRLAFLVKYGDIISL